MRHYEVVFLVHPDQSEQVPAMIERYRSMIAAGNGQVHRLEDWGRQVGAKLEDGLREGPSWIAFARENGSVYHTYTVMAPDPFVAPYHSALLERTPKPGADSRVSRTGPSPPSSAPFGFCASREAEPSSAPSSSDQAVTGIGGSFFYTDGREVVRTELERGIATGAFAPFGTTPGERRIAGRVPCTAAVRSVTAAWSS